MEGPTTKRTRLEDGETAAEEYDVEVAVPEAKKLTIMGLPAELISMVVECLATPETSEDVAEFSYVSYGGHSLIKRMCETLQVEPRKSICLSLVYSYVLTGTVKWLRIFRKIFN